jgi:hypothetical protein
MVSLPDGHQAGKGEIFQEQARLKKRIPEQEIVISRSENDGFAGGIIDTAYDGRDPGSIVCSDRDMPDSRFERTPGPDEYGRCFRLVGISFFQGGFQGNRGLGYRVMKTWFFAGRWGCLRAFVAGICKRQE